MYKMFWEIVTRATQKRLTDQARGGDVIGLRGVHKILDAMRHRTMWSIARWGSEEDRVRGVIYGAAQALKMFGVPQFSAFPGNVLLDEGINELWSLVAGTGGVKFDSANAYLGVGDSAAGEDHTHTGLQAAVNKLWKGMMATYPTYGTLLKATWKSEFTSAEANYAWNEFTVVNATSDTGDNLNRKVSAQGTKVSGQTWELTLEISLS